jgi:phosphohistidine phosphatase SixA
MLAIVLGFVVAGAAPAAADDAPWALLKGGGQVVMVRHAYAPGMFDPPGARPDDCTTQRNLDEQGRDEARRIGEAFRSRAIPVGDVRSSRWCRCLETARLAFGRVEAWSTLNGFLNDRSQEKPRTAEIRALASRPFTGGNIVLVTHMTNITAVTGLKVISGEMVVLTPAGNDTFTIAGRLAPNALTTGP